MTNLNIRSSTTMLKPLIKSLMILSLKLSKERNTKLRTKQDPIILKEEVKAEEEDIIVEVQGKILTQSQITTMILAVNVSIIQNLINNFV